MTLTAIKQTAARALANYLADKIVDEISSIILQVNDNSYDEGWGNQEDLEEEIDETVYALEGVQTSIQQFERDQDISHLSNALETLEGEVNTDLADGKEFRNVQRWLKDAINSLSHPARA